MSDLTLAQFRERVAEMRALGVTRWGDIELGQVPTAEAPTRNPSIQETAKAEEKLERLDRSLHRGAASGLVRRGID